MRRTQTLRAELPCNCARMRETERGNESACFLWRRDSRTFEFSLPRSVRSKNSKKNNEAHCQALGLLRRAGCGLRGGTDPAGTPPGPRQAHRGSGERVGVEMRSGRASERKREKSIKISKKNSIDWVCLLNLVLRFSRRDHLSSASISPSPSSLSHAPFPTTTTTKTKTKTKNSSL